jgi:hypothetical protein
LERTAPKGFIDQVLWPEFSELDHALQVYLHEATLRGIRQEIYSDTSEAQESFRGSGRRTDGRDQATTPDR